MPDSLTPDELAIEARAKAATPDWWPSNPYPESVFPMTDAEYVRAVPDPDLRTAISGFLCRCGWDVASRQINDSLRENNDALALLSALRASREEASRLRGALEVARGRFETLARIEDNEGLTNNPFDLQGCANDITAALAPEPRG